MSGKATIAIIAGHELLATNRSPPHPARRTRSARNHSRNNHRSSEPGDCVFTRGDDSPGDFVSENQGQGMTRRNTVKCEGGIGVANAAT